MRILVAGASGTGTSTLGRLIAVRLASQHFDIDDFLWEPSDPPFLRKRPVSARHALMETMFLPRQSWVVSGTPLGWEGPLVERLTLAIFLRLDQRLRIARLTARERIRVGADGFAEPRHREFMDWATCYDDPRLCARTLAGDLDWLAHLPCPVASFDAAQPAEVLVERVVSALDRIFSPA